MEYFSLSTHFEPLLKYSLAFLILFVLLPKVLKVKSKSGRFYGQYFDMVFFIIFLSYILIFIKLYELLAIFMIISMGSYYAMTQRQRSRSIALVVHDSQIKIFDFLDGLYKPNLKEEIKKYFKNKWFFIFRQQSKWIGLSFIIFGFAAWLVFYDAFVHAAPPLSDSYVTLAWMKYINQRTLFHDGLYPQGFHIYLSILSKFATTDPLFVFRYSGPLNAMLIMGSVSFFTKEITKSKSSGYFAAMVYGCSGLFFDSEMIRHAATNSQEFAIIFILPTLWYLVQYFEEEDLSLLVAAFSGLCITGFVHTLVFGFIVLMAVFIIISRLLIEGKKAFVKTWFVLGAGVIATIITLLPLGLGVLLGDEAHESSLDYLTGKVVVNWTAIGAREWLFIAGFIAISVLILLSKRDKEVQKRLITLFFIFGGVSFFYWVLPVLTKSLVIDSRKLVFMMLFVSIGAGMVLTLIIKPFEHKKSYDYFGIGITLIGFVLLVSMTYSGPFVPRKMERDNAVEQYLKISKTFPASEWMIVSHEEGYAMVLGTGFHMFVSDFMASFSPDTKVLTFSDDRFEKELKVPDVFIYYEKNVYRSEYESMKAVYDLREAEKPKLKAWLDAYQQNTGNLQVFYEDEDLIIYWIHVAFAQEDRFKEIWEY